MPRDTFNSTIQVACLAYLIHDDTAGRVIASLVSADLFEGDYRLIAEKAISYWAQYHRAPGHIIGDLLHDIFADPKQPARADTMRQLLIELLWEAERANPDYVLDQARSFVEFQRRKAALLRMAERLNTGRGLDTLDEVDAIWNELLHTKDVSFDPGLRLTDFDHVLDYLEKRSVEFSTGIRELDEAGVVPARGTVGLLLARTGAGKSWWLTHIGARTAVRLDKRVAHITLELSAEETMQRYYQNLYAVPKHKVPELELTKLVTETVKDSDGSKRVSLKSIDTVLSKFDFSFESPQIRDELKWRISEFSTQMHKNLVVKKFPTGSLSPQILRSYLDNLEVTQGFIPDMLIIDYIGIMAVDPKNHRLSLGHNLVELRGICDERKMAGITAQQVSRLGAKADNVSMTHIAEDWSLTNTADQVLAFSATDQEARKGLARLYVAKARSERDKFGLLLTQNYRIGKFVLESTLLRQDYYDKFMPSGVVGMEQFKEDAVVEDDDGS